MHMKQTSSGSLVCRLSFYREFLAVVIAQASLHESTRAHTKATGMSHLGATGQERRPPTTHKLVYVCRDAYKLQPLFTSTLLPGTIHRPMLFTPPGAQEEAGSPMSAVSVSALHGAVPGSGGRAQRSAWEALTPPLSHGKRTTEALTVVLRRIRSREEAA